MDKLNHKCENEIYTYNGNGVLCMKIHKLNRKINIISKVTFIRSAILTDDATSIDSSTQVILLQSFHLFTTNNFLWQEMTKDVIYSE